MNIFERIGYQLECDLIVMEDKGGMPSNLALYLPSKCNLLARLINIKDYTNTILKLRRYIHDINRRSKQLY